MAIKVMEQDKPDGLVNSDKVEVYEAKDVAMMVDKEPTGLKDVNHS